jgi:hypothetical protein
MGKISVITNKDEKLAIMRERERDLLHVIGLDNC